MPANALTVSRRAITIGLLVPVALGLLSERGRIVPATSSFDAVTPAQADVETGARLTFFETRVKRDPMDFYAYNELASSYLQRARELGDVADYRRAELALRRSIEIFSRSNFSAYLSLGSVQVGQHQFADALNSSERARAIRPAEPAVDSVAGDALLGLGRYDEAAAAYQRLVEKQPDLSSLSRMAQVHELRGDLDGAWSLYDQALAFDSPVPENIAWLRVQRGVLRYNRGDLLESESEFREGDTAFPGYVHALAGLARVQAARADYDNAIKLYQRVVNRMPLPQYVVEMGEVLAAAGRPDEAKQQYALIRAIDQLYQANGVDTDLQMSLYAADHESDLTSWLTRARGLAQRLPTIYAADALAWTLYRIGDFAGAEAAMTEALRLGTREPLLFFHAGMIARARGDRARALDFLEQMHALNPRFSVFHADTAARALDQLRKAPQNA